MNKGGERKENGICDIQMKGELDRFSWIKVPPQHSISNSGYKIYSRKLKKLFMYTYDWLWYYPNIQLPLVEGTELDTVYTHKGLLFC